MEIRHGNLKSIHRHSNGKSSINGVFFIAMLPCLITSGHMVMHT